MFLKYEKAKISFVEKLKIQYELHCFEWNILNVMCVNKEKLILQ
jgi:hypothetical protein